MRNILFYLLTLFVLSDVHAQVVADVFTNMIYNSVSTRVIKIKNDLDYIKQDLEIYQDYLNHEIFSDELFEEIQNEAVQTIEDRLYFQTIFNELIEKINRCNSIVSEYNRNSEYENPQFERLEVELISVLNNQAIFLFNYCFEVYGNRSYNDRNEISVKKYYRVDLITGTIHKIEVNLLHKQERIPEVILQKLNKMYAISTYKVELNEIENLGSENLFEAFFSRIDWQEAKIVPFFSGVVLSFDKCSNSSKIYNGQSFQVFFNFDEVKQFSKLIPDYKLYFGNPPQKTTLANQLLEDFDFKFQQLMTSPEKLDFFREPTKPFVRQLEIEVYPLNSEEKEKTELYRFNQNGQVISSEVKYSNNTYFSKKEYNYFPNGKLKSKIEDEDEITLFHYKNNQISFTEEILRDDEIEDWGEDMGMLERHYFYNNDYNYSFTIGYFDDLNDREMTAKYILNNELCNGRNCLVLDENKNVTAVNTQKYGTGGQVLLNENGKVLESHFDNDRQQYYFTYDEMGRISSLKKYGDRKLGNQVFYKYEGKSEIPSVITKKGPAGNKEYRYKVEY